MSAEFFKAIAEAARTEKLRKRASLVIANTSGAGVADRVLLWRSDGNGMVYVDFWRAAETERRTCPCDMVFVPLTVGYWEVAGKRRAWREPGDVVFHRAGDKFLIELEPDFRARPAVLVLSKSVPTPTPRKARP